MGDKRNSSFASRKRSKGKTKRSFSPDAISTRIAEALRRDLRGEVPNVIVKQEYDDYVIPGDCYADRQVVELLKKYRSQTQDVDELTKVTYRAFRKVCGHIGDINRSLSLPGALPDPRNRLSRHSSWLDRVLLRARSLAHEVLGPFSHDEWFDECKHSSGTSLGLKFSKTNIEDKCTFPLTITANLVPLWHYYLAYDWQLKNALMAFNETVPYGPAWVETVEGSRSTTVDKDDRKRRLIAVEPTLNMFFQQGLMGMMVKRLGRIGLDIERLQSQHQSRAWTSSITGREATVDWSSASDCVSITFLEWLIPPVWFEVLKQVRCPVTSIDGQTVPLPMISTMGNATTFPVETLVFWVLGVAVCSLRDDSNSQLVKPAFKELVSVFGDDCILPRVDVSKFLDVCHYVGFLVNDEKSFYSPGAGFRESCGGDFLAGHNVRPFYLKAPHNTNISSLEPWLYIAFNRLKTKYIQYFGTLSYAYDKALWREFNQVFLEYHIQLKVVPSYYPDDAGLKISEDILRLQRNFSKKLRWSRVLVDKHGTAVFSFCRFQYDEKTKPSPDIRLWRELKFGSSGGHGSITLQTLKRKLKMAKRPNLVGPMLYINKRIGGYVVGKGKSFWTGPT